MQTDVLQFPKRSESCHEGYQSFPSIKKFNIFWKEEKDQKGVRSYFTLLIFVSLFCLVIKKRGVWSLNFFLKA